MFELRQVSKSFANTVAVDNMDLTVNAGETTVLIGPSGCGKSTLLRLLIGLIRPDRGQVSFQGEVITPQNATQLRHNMGYVIQDGGLFPHLTGRQNVTLLARHLGWKDPDLRQRLAELADLTHFPHDGLDRYPAQLSGGQRQRVGLMRALVLDPNVLLMDEPLGALDPMIRANLQEELKSIFRKLGKTVVMVTHDLGEAAYFGHQIVLLRKGRIVQKGQYRDLLHEPAETFVSEFVQAQRAPLAAMQEAAQ